MSQVSPNVLLGARGEAGPSRDVAQAAEALRQRLERVRRRAWWMLVAQRVGLVVGVAILALMMGVMLDYLLRAPAWLRALGLAGAIGTLVWAVVAIVRPAVQFRPTLTEMALRIEKASAGQEAGLADLLAAGLELGGAGEAGIGSGDRRLAARVVVEAAARADRLESRGLMSLGKTGRSIGLFTLALMVMLGVMSAEPRLAGIGASRMLWPWGGAEWPKRTGIADATDVRVHPLGTALALRAALTKHSGNLNATNVEARYRVIADGRSGAEQRVLLTGQDRAVVVGQEDGTSVSGALFERLIEPKSLMPERAGTAAGPGGKVELEYVLASDDDETPPVRIALVEPPAVVKATAVVTPPAYLSDSAVHASAPLAGGVATLDLGTGADERGAPAPVLAGSRVSLSLEFNKPLARPGDAEAEARALGTDAARVLSAEGGGALRAEGSKWILEWTLNETVRLNVRAVDEHGIAGTDEAVFRIDALADKPPTATVTLPTEDKSVLATALVEIAAEARDDVGLASVSLQTRTARRTAGSEGAAPEPIGEEREWARVTGSQGAGEDGSAKRLTVGHTLDLSALDAKPGDEIWITALAADTYSLGGKRHEAVRSSIRRLRVLAREELIEQVWSELAGVRRSAIKIDQDQEQARQNSQRPGSDAARQVERAQSGISERIARQVESTRKIQQRLAENSLADPALNQVVTEAREALARAGEKSVQAAGEMGKAAQEESAEDASTEAGKKERQEAEQSQQGVRDELGTLIELLDQGEDTFASKRALERLLEQQKSLKQRTSEQAKQTAGKSIDQLSGEQKQALEQIAQEQKAQAESLRDAVKRMQDREKKLEKSDEAAAQAMAQAASRAEREQVAQKMEQAAQHAQKNQVGAAQQQQASAQQSLEQMLQDLNQAQSNRDEVLRRFLASLIDSIQGLIQTQRTQLTALGDGIASGALRGLDAGMVGLHQNTLGVLDQASQGPRELMPVARMLDGAAEAEAKSVVLLRAEPVKGDETRDQEQESLEKLIEAKAIAEKMDKQAEDRQQDRKREELRKQYQELLAQQVSIKDSTEGLAQQEVSRRTRAAARQLAEEQVGLKTAVAKIRDGTKELRDAKVFDFAHQRLETLLNEAVTDLEKGEASAAVVRRQTAAARLLKSLIEALGDSKSTKSPEKSFRESEGGGGGAGKPPLVPPAAEVSLLRALQEEAHDLTRVAGDAGDKVGADEFDQAARLQRDVAQQAVELMERMKRESQGGGGPAPQVEPKPSQDPTVPPTPPAPGGGQGGDK